MQSRHHLCQSSATKHIFAFVHERLKISRMPRWTGFHLQETQHGHSRKPQPLHRLSQTSRRPPPGMSLHFSRSSQAVRHRTGQAQLHLRPMSAKKPKASLNASAPGNYPGDAPTLGQHPNRRYRRLRLRPQAGRHQSRLHGRDKGMEYRLGENPMDAARRPTYWNERDHRLRGGDEQRLIALAIEEDRPRSIELRVEKWMTSKRKVAAGLPSIYAGKKYIQLNAAPKPKFCRKKTRQQRAG